MRSFYGLGAWLLLHPERRTPFPFFPDNVVRVIVFQVVRVILFQYAGNTAAKKLVNNSRII